MVWCGRSKEGVNSAWSRVSECVQDKIRMGTMGGESLPLDCLEISFDSKIVLGDIWRILPSGKNCAAIAVPIRTGEAKVRLGRWLTVII